MKSKTARAAPIRTKPITERLEPNLLKDFTATELPIVKHCETENAFEKSALSFTDRSTLPMALPITERDDPRRAKPRKDNDEPMCAKPYTDKADPRRAKLRTEKDDPICKS
jgi:hypothetical protein